MVVINELSKQITIITTLLIIIVGAYILNSSLDYYNATIQESDTFVSNSVDLVETAAESKKTYTTKTLIIGTNEAYNLTVENRSGNLLGEIAYNINDIVMKGGPLHDETNVETYNYVVDGTVYVVTTTYRIAKTINHWW